MPAHYIPLSSLHVARSIRCGFLAPLLLPKEIASPVETKRSKLMALEQTNSRKDAPIVRKSPEKLFFLLGYLIEYRSPKVTDD